MRCSKPRGIIWLACSRDSMRLSLAFIRSSSVISHQSTRATRLGSGRHYLVTVWGEHFELVTSIELIVIQHTAHCTLHPRSLLLSALRSVVLSSDVPWGVQYSVLYSVRKLCNTHCSGDWHETCTSAAELAKTLIMRGLDLLPWRSLSAEP